MPHLSANVHCCGNKRISFIIFGDQGMFCYVFKHTCLVLDLIKQVVNG